MKHVILTIAVFLALRVSHGADLNALGEKQITIGTEISRGMAAVPGSSIASPRNIQRFDKIVSSISAANEQAGKDSAGFTFGFYYAAWHDVWLFLAGDFYRGAERDLAIEDAKIYFMITQAQKKKLGLTDEDVRKVASVRYVLGEEDLFPRLLLNGKFAGTVPPISR